MIRNTFFHDGVKKATVLFGTLFNEIQITRLNANNESIGTYVVPLEYGPREKALARVTEDPDLDRSYAVKLPRISFEITAMLYDGTRKIPTVTKFAGRYKTEDNKTINRSTYAAVPYNINFQLSIMTKSLDDGNKIIEQILPFFTPDWTLSANLIDDMPERLFDIPVVLNDISSTDDYAEDFKTRRTLTWTLNFTMKFMFFGPVSKAKVIKLAKANIITNWETTTPISSVTVQPGLTANGEPTTILGDSISYLDIEETDPYGYIVTIEDNI